MTTPPPPPTGLRCAYLTNPLGVAPDRLRLSWLLAADADEQRAYQVLVTRCDYPRCDIPTCDYPTCDYPRCDYPTCDYPISEYRKSGEWRGVGQRWDSGRVDSGATTDIPYGGVPVEAGARYAWRVRVWGAGAEPSDWSESATFEVELDQATGWHGDWIGLGRVRTEIKPPSLPGPSDPIARALTPVPYLRREFAVTGPVASARLHITALGLYEARINGERVGDALLTPGWTDYHQRVQYQTYDVTSLVRTGPNVLGALLGEGWYCGFIGFDTKRAGSMYGEAPELLAELVITLADGGSQRVATDRHWQASFGAIGHADLLMGARYEPAREPAGWDAPGFDAQAWQPVHCRPRDGVKLVADPGPPVRVTQELPAVSLHRDPAGRQIADFGQNLTGWIRIAWTGPGGAHLKVRHAEVLNPDGSLYTDNLRTARQADEYVTGPGPQVLEPRFTLHGFRYAEISGCDEDLDPAALTARVVHSDIGVTGSFESSQDWLNQLFGTIDWGERGNFISVPTDCPQRDERLGWLGDAQIFARTASYNRDVAAFFGKWLDDVADAQFPSGAFPDIAPRVNLAWGGAPGWADAGVIIPWTLLKMYGDRGNAARHYPAMTAWMDYLERGNPDFLRSRDLGNSYNDWLAPGDDRTPPELLGTAYWAHDAALMSEVAQALGRDEDSAAYRALRAKIGAAFAGAFVAADGTITSGTQTAYVLGLHMRLIPDDLRAAAAENLVGAIERQDGRLTTGFVGVGYLLPVLSSTGHDDVAYRLLGQEARPSWRYMLNNGATTIWERWDGWTAERGFQSAWMNSFNHYALGSVGEWLYRFVLGIDLAPGAIGFDRLEIRPHPGGGLDWARGAYESVRGRIASGWHQSEGAFSLMVEIPAGVSASVRVPSAAAGEVRDSRGAGPAGVAEFPGALGIGEAVFHVGHGIHEFTGPGI